MFTIKVVSSSSGNPIKGKRVRVGFKGLRGMTVNGHTDSNGEVHFNNDPGEGEVYVDGRSKFKGKIKGRVVIYI